jgi:hypothetical protein
LARKSFKSGTAKKFNVAKAPAQKFQATQTWKAKIWQNKTSCFGKVHTKFICSKHNLLPNTKEGY